MLNFYTNIVTVKCCLKSHISSRVRVLGYSKAKVPQISFFDKISFFFSSRFSSFFFDVNSSIVFTLIIKVVKDKIICKFYLKLEFVQLNRFGNRGRRKWSAADSCT